MIIGVVPAGGASRRMGQPKLLLPFAGRSILEHVITALLHGGATHVVVAAAPELPQLVELGERAGALPIVLPAATPDMRATVEFALRWIDQHLNPQPSDAWLLTPGDHPMMEPMAVRLLIEAHASDPGHSVFVPSYQGRRGHPVLVSWEHVPALLAFPPGRGLNEYLREVETERVEVPVPCPGILQDVDTPEEYGRVLKARQGHGG